MGELEQNLAEGREDLGRLASRELDPHQGVVAIGTHSGRKCFRQLNQAPGGDTRVGRQPEDESAFFPIDLGEPQVIRNDLQTSVFEELEDFLGKRSEAVSSLLLELFQGLPVAS